MAEPTKEGNFWGRLRKVATNKIENAKARWKVLQNTISNRQVSGRQMMSDRERLRTILTIKELGKLSMFFYDPKGKETLPYYDRFPLILPIELYDDGFLGLNFHYIPPYLRARLMDLLYDHVFSVEGAHQIDEKKRIRITYRILKGLQTSRYMKPMIKRYLYTHLRSRIYILNPLDWEIALYLPSERFEKANKRQVQRESVRMIRG